MATSTRDKPLRIVFMGSPRFAAYSFERMLRESTTGEGQDRGNEEAFKVLAVVTAPDKPAGRNLSVKSTAVRQAASEHGIPVLQPASLKSVEFLQHLKDLQPDLFVVVAFRILPKEVLSIPGIGSINLHASLLPRYRGAAPINWVLINGETETGITTFMLDKGIDTGDLLFREEEAILPEDNAGTLHDRLMIKGADLLVKTVNAIIKGDAKPFPQEAITEKTVAPRIFPEHCSISFSGKTMDAHNLIRGLSPSPGAFFELDGKRIKVYSANRFLEEHGFPAGEMKVEGNRFRIFFQDGFLELDEIQPEGKKRMKAADFLRGHRSSKQ